MKIWSPMPSGSGAHVVHRQLEAALPDYRLCLYPPALTYFPPALWTRCQPHHSDLVHTTPEYAWFFARQHTRLAVTFHNYVLDEEMQPYGSALQRLHWRTDLRWLTRIALKRAAIVTAVSDFTADLVRSDLGYTGAISVIHNGVDTERFRPQPRAGSERVRVLFSGNPTARKGAQWLTDIAARLAPGIDIVCTGGLRDERGSGSERIHQLGPVAYGDMPQLYRSVDMLLLPTVREGHSLAVLEAMASGLPVVASDCSSLPEQVAHERGGYLVEVGDVTGFAAAINRLAVDEALRRMMGDFNRARAVQRYQPAAMVQQYRDVFGGV